MKIEAPISDASGKEIGVVVMTLKPDANAQELTEFFTEAMHLAGYSRNFYLDLQMETDDAN